MTTFALVHGGWHGAECWNALSPFLRDGGHNVIAMDLPCEDPTANFSDYADVVCDSLRGCDDDLVLVGHSMGGQTIPLVAARRPVQHLVYLCALVPNVGLSLAEQLAEEPTMLREGWDSALSEPDLEGRTSWVDGERTKELLYADCDDATVVTAIAGLRPQASYPLGFTFPLREFPPVPATSVICREDRMLGNDWARTVAGDRLGAKLVELPGSHSPFLSRPAELAEILLAVPNS